MTIALTIFTTVVHELATFAVNKTLQTKAFDAVYIFSDKKLEITHPHYWIEISPKLDRQACSHFLLKNLGDYIETDHVLIIQPDGMATKAQYWDDEFLNYDYIGAPYNINEKHTNDGIVNHFGLTQYKDVNKWVVGNGGFCLRSKKLLNALQSSDIDGMVTNPHTGEKYYGEDFQITFINRELLENKFDIKFAPIEVALRFSTERLADNGMSYGFHGWQNMPWFLTEDECIFYLQNLRPNWDYYRLNRLAGFFYENGYYNAMTVLNNLREQWNAL
jgi:hypothetical protein